MTTLITTLDERLSIRHLVFSKATLKELLHDDLGQDLIEYALAGFLIGLACVSAVSGLAPKISAAYNSVSSTLNSAI